MQSAMQWTLDGDLMGQTCLSDNVSHEGASSECCVCQQLCPLLVLDGWHTT